jgi:hypothetical protein
MLFFIIAFVGMYIGRKIGWALSRGILYFSSTPTAVTICVVWGVLVAFGVHVLNEWQHPNIILKIIMGYALGAYVSIPNFGLLNESTIPEKESSRHEMISLLPMTTYIIAIILLEWLF